ncbi:hypothetical protein [Pseudomonas sp. S2_A05]
MPWYKSGTVSVTQNSNAVIGTGTAFIANSRVGDGFRGPDGRWYEVTNIASNTALSISPNYEGPTAADGLYSIVPVQGYQKDLADQVRKILNDYGGVLAVLGTTPTTAGVRDELNLTDTDGLPEGQTNKYMTAAGVRGTALEGVDVATPGAVAAADSILSALGKLQATKADLSGTNKTVAIEKGGTGATTPALARAALGLTILGTVSQSGGAPTGALMEYGSNANGEYWKFANGFMVCISTKSVIVAISSALGGLYWKGAADRPADTLPANFAVAPWAHLIIGGEYPGFSETVIMPTTGTFGIIRHLSPVALPLATYTYTFIAVGRWF